MRSIFVATRQVKSMRPYAPHSSALNNHILEQNVLLVGCFGSGAGHDDYDVRGDLEVSLMSELTPIASIVGRCVPKLLPLALQKHRNRSSQLQIVKTGP